MAKKWIESVIDDFISKNKTSGTLSDKQFQTFSRSMDQKTSDFYGRNTVSYTYNHRGYKFTLYGKNKFTLTNENNWQIEKLENEIERVKGWLKVGIARNKPQSFLDECTDKIKDLEKEIEIYLGA